MTKIIKCDCKNEYQDEKYGVFMRVHNALKDFATKGFRCTVCGRINQ